LSKYTIDFGSHKKKSVLLAKPQKIDIETVKKCCLSQSYYKDNYCKLGPGNLETCCLLDGRFFVFVKGVL